MILIGLLLIGIALIIVGVIIAVIGGLPILLVVGKFMLEAAIGYGIYRMIKKSKGER